VNHAPHDDAGLDWEDRLVDRALQDLHGDRPPDLAAAVERALRAGAATGGANRRISDGAGGGRLTAGTLAAMVLAAAALLCALLSWAWTPPAAWSGAGARFEVAVAQGELTLLSAGRAPMPPITAGNSAAMLIARGDQLHTAAHADTAMNLGPFGSVRTAPATVLEVVDMDVRTKNGWVTAGSLALAVVAGGASWHFIGSRTSAVPGEVINLHTDGDGALAAELQAARSSGDRLKDENDALRHRIDALEAAARERVATAAAAPPAPAEDAAPVAAAPATQHAPTFEDANYADLLGSIDWEAMGKVAAQMGVPLVELMKKLEAGEELPMELAVEIGKLNMQLVSELPKIMKAGLPGTPGNGVYTHPLIVGNQLASLLQSGNLPLDAGQRAAIGALVRGFSAEASAIQDGATELDLDRVVAEVAMKDRMYDEIAQQLSPEQRALIYPEGAGNYDGTSLFRSGLIWQQVVSPVEASDPAGYVDTTVANLATKFHFEGAVADQVRAILDQTARAAPSEVWSAGGAIERSANARFLRTGRAMRAAQLQQSWMRRVLREVPLSEAQRKQLRSMQKVIVPVPR
jgi:hypothetical protein